MKGIKVIFNIFLATSIVVFSCGLGIGKMVCLSSGDVSVELFNIEDCCGEPEAGVSLEEKCCDISNSTFALNAFTFIKYTPDLSNTALNFSGIPEIFSFAVPQITIEPKFSIDRPPPLSGVKLLHSIRVLII